MKNLLPISLNVIVFNLDITENHIIYFETKIFEDIKEFTLTEMPLDFRRYIILNNKAKRHLSHIGFQGITQSIKTPFGSPSRMMKRELNKEMY
jgi:hypothetical protein